MKKERQYWECNSCGASFTKLASGFVGYVPELTAEDVE